MEHIPCESVVFDLDGTLWDPMELSMESWRRACLEHGVDTKLLERERFANAFGHPANDVAEIVLPGMEKSHQTKVPERANDMEVQLNKKVVSLQQLQVRYYRGIPTYLWVGEIVRRLHMLGRHPARQRHQHEHVDCTQFDCCIGDGRRYAERP